MSYHNRYLRLRVKSVQIFDSLYFERENHQKCHKRNWERMGCFIFGISYDTYLSYLKMDTSDVPDMPSEALAMLDRLTAELLGREKHPVRLVRSGSAASDPMPEGLKPVADAEKAE